VGRAAALELADLRPDIGQVDRGRDEATPRMISHSGLVSLPAATKAGAGLMMPSINAHASTPNAATASATKK
jgi:hypothetical protein